MMMLIHRICMAFKGFGIPISVARAMRDSAAILVLSWNLTKLRMLQKMPFPSSIAELEITENYLFLQLQKKRKSNPAMANHCHEFMLLRENNVFQRHFCYSVKLTNLTFIYCKQQISCCKTNHNADIRVQSLELCLCTSLNIHNIKTH